jgi:hypothetical protein
MLYTKYRLAFTARSSSNIRYSVAFASLTAGLLFYCHDGISVANNQLSVHYALLSELVEGVALLRICLVFLAVSSFLTLRRKLITVKMSGRSSGSCAHICSIMAMSCVSMKLRFRYPGSRKARLWSAISFWKQNNNNSETRKSIHN